MPSEKKQPQNVMFHDRVMILMFVFPQNLYAEDFPRGMVDENPPANARGMGLIPGPERCVPSYVEEQLKPVCLHTLEPMPRNKRCHHFEKPSHHRE